MTEIGLAQQRLLDDEASSAAHRLPSTATPYSSEISQPGSFPTMPTYQDQQMNEPANGLPADSRPIQAASAEATQLLVPIQAQVHDYSTLAASTHVDSPMVGSEHITTHAVETQSLGNAPASRPQIASQRSKSFQSVPYSPHDTEPMSSLVSPRLNRTKSDNTRSRLMSPRSPVDTHDELSLPAVAVEVSNVKKPGRPNKRSIPDDDEDDELAGPRESDLGNMKPCEKDSDPLTRAPVVNSPLVNDVHASNPVTNASDTAERPVSKQSKKKKVKKSKTADAVIQKDQVSATNEGVILVDSKPIQADGSKGQIDNPSTVPETESSEPLQPGTTKPTEDDILNEEKPAPKKRGRKRKQTTEQVNTELDQASKENQPPEDSANTPEGERFMDNLEPEFKHTNELQDLDQKTPGPINPSKTSAPKEELPQTPQKDGDTKQDTPNTNTNTTSNGSNLKKPGSHSPISSTGKVPYRVGLSKRARIAPLLRIVRK